MEYACRAGTTTDYCNENWDGELRQVGWFDGNADGSTKPVGQLKANAWNLHDMHGNVWEWCSDWFDDKYYAQSTKDDPQGPASGSNRVYRGGAWSYSGGYCGSANRSKNTPDYRSSRLGFRVSASSIEIGGLTFDEVVAAIRAVHPTPKWDRLHCKDSILNEPGI